MNPEQSQTSDRFAGHGARLAILIVVLLLSGGTPAAAAVANDSTATVAACSDSLRSDSIAAREHGALLDSLNSYSTRNNLPGFDFASGEKKSESGWVWVVSSILIVIGLLYLFLYLLRRFFHSPGGALGANGQFELLQQFHLGQKRNLTLIKVCGRILLLGVTDHSINTLMEISDEEELRRLEASLNEQSGRKRQNFRDIYQGLVGRMKN